MDGNDVVIQWRHAPTTIRLTTSSLEQLSVPVSGDGITAAHLALLQDYVDANVPHSVDSTIRMACVVFAYLFTQLCTNTTGFDVDIASEIPLGAGLGSSGAFSTVLAAALLVHFGHIAHTDSFASDDLQIINRWAFLAETIIHGRPSGVDNTVSCYGGFIHFCQGKMTPLDWYTIAYGLIACSDESIRVLIVNSGVPRNTKQLVASVARMHHKLPLVVEPVFDAIDGIAATFQVATDKQALLAVYWTPLHFM